MGIDSFKKLVESNFILLKNKELNIDEEFLKNIKSFFKLPITKSEESKTPISSDLNYNNWLIRNVIKHKLKGYSIVLISLKNKGEPPDATSKQMRKIASIASDYSCK